uniref:Uncharacterized protein n=1 Tax=Octopus bimaculoides TaxID=37653 RepID=A0A0L8HAA6_OCTBM
MSDLAFLLHSELIYVTCDLFGAMLVSSCLDLQNRLTDRDMNGDQVDGSYYSNNFLLHQMQNDCKPQRAFARRYYE